MIRLRQPALPSFKQYKQGCSQSLSVSNSVICFKSTSLELDSTRKNSIMLCFFTFVVLAFHLATAKPAPVFNADLSSTITTTTGTTLPLTSTSTSRIPAKTSGWPESMRARTVTATFLRTGSVPTRYVDYLFQWMSHPSPVSSFPLAQLPPTENSIGLPPVSIRTPLTHVSTNRLRSSPPFSQVCTVQPRVRLFLMT